MHAHISLQAPFPAGVHMTTARAVLCSATGSLLAGRERSFSVFLFP